MLCVTPHKDGARRWFVGAFLLLCLAVSLPAQFTTASLAGTVLDSTGASIPEATVIVRNTDTGFTQTVKSGPTGAFLFSRLPIGAYELRVEKEGFGTYVQSGIGLTVDRAANVPVSLQVGRITDQVTVTGDTELVTTQTATGGQLIDQRRIVELPLQGRRPERLMYLAAGTVDLGRNEIGRAHV